MFGTLLWSSRCFWSSFPQLTKPKAVYNALREVQKFYASGMVEMKLKIGWGHLGKVLCWQLALHRQWEFMRQGGQCGGMTKWYFRSLF